MQQRDDNNMTNDPIDSKDSSKWYKLYIDK